jgi:hypothetical protein
MTRLLLGFGGGAKPSTAIPAKCLLQRIKVGKLAERATGRG